MLRSAAKNYQDVVVIVDPGDYIPVLNEIRETGDVSLKTRLKLSYKVFQHTSHYDTLIQQYLRKQLAKIPSPRRLPLHLKKVQDMRYGENRTRKRYFTGKRGI